jgi:DNA-binding LytR/AlgR family response regulator
MFISSITNLANELADKGFMRISQSYLVNIAYVFNVSGKKETKKKGKPLTVGRAYKKALNEAIAKREASKWKI